jgi:hypothetical protein
MGGNFLHNARLQPLITLVSCFTISFYSTNDRLCGLVVRVLGYKSGGLGPIPGTTRKKK